MVEEFRAFLSYAHHDKVTDPELLSALTTELENRVNAKLLNARFSIWRDSRLQIGETWNEKIDAEIRRSDIFILLFSPQWLQSEWCIREYSVFEQEEKTRSVAGYVPEYVAPIVIRSIEGRETHLNPEQAAVFERIKTRQYVLASATAFLASEDKQRRAFIDTIADDIEGMIERRRLLKDEITSTVSPSGRSDSKKRSLKIRRSTMKRSILLHLPNSLSTHQIEEIHDEFTPKWISSSAYMSKQPMRKLISEYAAPSCPFIMQVWATCHGSTASDVGSPARAMLSFTNTLMQLAL